MRQPRIQNGLSSHADVVSTSPTVKRYVWFILLLWSTTIPASLCWSLLEIKRGIMNEAHTQASVAFDKDVAYRRWAAKPGGVYVPISNGTPPNPYLSHIPERLALLAGGIAHDFNNLLPAILGNTGLILQDLPEDSPVRPLVDSVE